MAHEVALKLVLMGHSLLLHPLLTVHAHLPVFLHSLISADMDILVWEELYNLIKHCLKELESPVISYAQVP